VRRLPKDYQLPRISYPLRRTAASLHHPQALRERSVRKIARWVVLNPVAYIERRDAVRFEPPLIDRGRRGPTPAHCRCDQDQKN
jgi:hypothetical protein